MHSCTGSRPAGGDIVDLIRELKGPTVHITPRVDPGPLTIADPIEVGPGTIVQIFVAPPKLGPSDPGFTAPSDDLKTFVNKATAANAAASLGDDDNVVRGGRNTPDDWRRGAERVDEEGKVVGVSGRASPGASVGDLVRGAPGSRPIPNGQIGATTVGRIKDAGGQVIRTPKTDDSFHCDICGLTPERASELFTPTQTNVWRRVE